MASFILKGLTREVRKMVRTDDGNGRIFSRAETVGTESADIEVEVDMDYLARALGEKALKSKHSKSKAQHGAIRVRAVNRRMVTK
jgi:hypothetical protein